MVAPLASNASLLVQVDGSALVCVVLAQGGSLLAGGLKGVKLDDLDRGRDGDERSSCPASIWVFICPFAS